MKEQKLIIAEKPSVARSIAAALGSFRKKNNYLENEDYLISWCIGHMAGFASVDTYDKRFKKWTKQDLPIIPRSWTLTVSKSCRDQLFVLKELMNRESVAAVINACDAGREGELIFRNLYQLTNCTKPVQRLWISSMEESAIRDGLQNLRDGSEYDSLYASALCRAKADWLVGINATRFFSLCYDRTLSVGRVMSPTLALIVKREEEINDFVPEHFYTVALEKEGFHAVSQRFARKEEARSKADGCNGRSAVVTNISEKECRENAPRLFDLTTLQRTANRQLGYTAKQTLDYTQALYEKKFCTYPRTDSRYLTEDMEAQVPKLAEIAAGALKQPVPESISPRQICNSKKVSDHYAIVPTLAAEKLSLKSLSKGELEIYQLICRQLLCAVAPAHTYTVFTYTLRCGDVELTGRHKQATEPGWRLYVSPETEENEDESSEAPFLRMGEAITDLRIVVKEGKTTAPKYYTEDRLLLAMENAGKEEMPVEERVSAKVNDFVTTQRKGLGTPATRAATIEKLITQGFLCRKKAGKSVKLFSTAKGKALVKILPEMLASPMLTAEWEWRLEEIEKGTGSAERFLTDIGLFLEDLIGEYIPVNTAGIFPPNENSVGRCPRCGSDVTKLEKGFFCQNRECTFSIWFDNRYLSNHHIPVNTENIRTLLRDGKLFVPNIYSGRAGHTYAGVIHLEDDGQKIKFRVGFQNG